MRERGTFQMSGKERYSLVVFERVAKGEMILVEAAPRRLVRNYSSGMRTPDE